MVFIFVADGTCFLGNYLPSKKFGILVSGEHPCPQQTSMHGQCMIGVASSEAPASPKSSTQKAEPDTPVASYMQLLENSGPPSPLQTGRFGDSPRTQRYKRWYWRQNSLTCPLNEVHNVSSEEDVCLDRLSDSHSPAERLSTPVMQFFGGNKADHCLPRLDSFCNRFRVCTSLQSGCNHLGLQCLQRMLAMQFPLHRAVQKNDPRQQPHVLDCPRWTMTWPKCLPRRSRTVLFRFLAACFVLLHQHFSPPFLLTSQQGKDRNEYALNLDAITMLCLVR